MARQCAAPVLLFLSWAVLAGCNRPKPVDEIGAGTLTGNTYAHDYFNFKITFPDGWHIMSQQAHSEMMKAAQEAAAGDNEQLKARAKAAEAKGVHLIAAFELPPEAGVGVNPGIMISAERVGHVRGVVDGATYLSHAQKHVMQQPLQTRIDAIEPLQVMGPLAMHVLPVHVEMGTQEVHQRLHATRVRDYVLVIATLYTTEEERKQLDEILQSIEPAGSTK